MVNHARSDVNHVDHGRDDGGDAGIDGADNPGRPAALRAARDDEFLHGDFAAFFAAEKLRRGIHCPDGTFSHGKARQPCGVSGVHVLDPTIGDQVVLDALLAVVVENQRLVGNHAEINDDGVRAQGKLHGLRIGTVRRSAVLLPLIRNGPCRT